MFLSSALHLKRLSLELSLSAYVRDLRQHLPSQSAVLDAVLQGCLRVSTTLLSHKVLKTSFYTWYPTRYDRNVNRYCDSAFGFSSGRKKRYKQNFVMSISFFPDMAQFIPGLSKSVSCKRTLIYTFLRTGFPWRVKSIFDHSQKYLKLKFSKIPMVIISSNKRLLSVKNSQKRSSKVIHFYCLNSKDSS